MTDDTAGGDTNPSYLTGPARAQLHVALVAAFPTEPDLARLISFGLNQNPSAIAGGANLRDRVFQLITWAESRHQINHLLAAAGNANPDNPLLHACLDRLRHDSSLRTIIPPVEATLPKPLVRPAWTVPYPANPTFVGRETEIRKIANLLKNGNQVAITGSGGLGKTHLAAEYAHAHQQDYSGGVFWLFMENPANIPVKIAEWAGPGGLSIFRAETMSFEDRVAAVRAAWETPEQRLLIFDNCESPSLLIEWCPTNKNSGSHIIITSRRQVWPIQLGIKDIPLTPLTRPASLSLLLSARPDAIKGNTDSVQIPSHNTQLAAADTICSEVGDLPLALTLIAAYLEVRPNITLNRYLTHLREYPFGNLALGAKLERDFPIRHTSSITSTFALSYDQLNPDQPNDALALKLLCRAAYCASEPIPRRLLLRTAEVDPDDEDASEEADTSLYRLATLGLLERLPDNTFRLHRLLAAYIRTRVDNPLAEETAIAVALSRELHAIYKAGYPQAGTSLISHARHTANRVSSLNRQGVADLFDGLAVLLQELGEYTTAQPLFEGALAIYEQLAGSHHPSTAASLGSLGRLLQEMGNYDGARPLLERSLAIYKETLGSNHISTAGALNNLAGVLQSLGEYVYSRPLLEQALATYEQVLGPVHPRTATALNNLASLSQELGEYATARPLLERALAIHEEFSGPNHPNTAISLSSLARLLQTLGEYNTARSLFERSLMIYEQVFGPNHPLTARGLSNLAELLQELGGYTAAKPLFERALAIHEEIFGPIHPNTASSLSNLGMLLRDAGEYSIARSLFERALVIQQKALGPTHPLTAKELNNLDRLLRLMGEYSAARPLAEQALAIYEQAFGPTHPRTAGSLGNLAGVLQELGEYATARPLAERALAIYEQAIGRTNPTTAGGLNNLAGILRGLGEYSAAQALLERALAIYKQVFDIDHPRTATVLSNLAGLLEYLDVQNLD